MAQRYFIRFSYKGTNYHGWQVQDNAVTVQQRMNEALNKLLKDEIHTVGAGRTDTGVHAEEMFAHFDNSETLADIPDFIYHLNACLPNDIAVKQILPVQQEAHARFDAVSRQYRYVIAREKDPFTRDLAYYFTRPLDVKKMNQAASYLLDVKDFTSFSKLHTQTKTNNCDVIKAAWEQKSGQLVFTIKADRFLRNMVRAIVGTLIEVGKGKVSWEEFKEIIAKKDRSEAGYSVPAQGLFLEKIEYPEGIYKLK